MHKKLILMLSIFITAIPVLLADVRMSKEMAQKLALSIGQITVTKGMEKKVGTGFLWNDAHSFVTAYHVVAGNPDSMEIHFTKTNWKISKKDITIKRILKEADLVLLELNHTYSTALPLVKNAYDYDGMYDLTVIGYPKGINTSIGRTLVPLIDYPEKLIDLLNSEMRENISRAVRYSGFDMGIEIIPFQSGLLKGDSGAPIFDDNGTLVAIGNGGYKDFDADLCWSIPASFLDKLLGSKDKPAIATVDESNFWYGWTETDHKMKIDEMRKEENFDEVGKYRILPKVVLSVSSEVPIKDEDTLLHSSLFIRLFPFDYNFLSKDRFLLGAYLSLVYIPNLGIYTYFPNDNLAEKATEQYFNVSCGAAGIVYLLEKYLYLECSVAYPINVQAKLGFNIINNGHIKAGLDMAILYYVRNIESYRFDFFGNAHHSTHDEYKIKILVGFNIGYNDVLIRRYL